MVCPDRRVGNWLSGDGSTSAFAPIRNTSIPNARWLTRRSAEIRFRSDPQRCGSTSLGPFLQRTHAGSAPLGRSARPRVDELPEIHESSCRSGGPILRPEGQRRTGTLFPAMLFSAHSVSHSLNVSQILNSGFARRKPSLPSRKASPARFPKLLDRARELMTRRNTSPQPRPALLRLAFSLAAIPAVQIRHLPDIQGSAFSVAYLKAGVWVYQASRSDFLGEHSIRGRICRLEPACCSSNYWI